MFLSTSTDLRPLTTAHLAQTMHLLELSTLELADAIASELADNPALEMVDERRCPNCGRPLPNLRRCPTCAASDGSGDPIVYLTPRDTGSFGGYGSDAEEAESREVQAHEAFGEYLLRQIGPELAVEDRQTAAYLIASLDENGFLTEPLAESARYLRVSLTTIERILKLIRRADPIGTGTRDSRESLLVQLEVLEDEGPTPPLARRMITDSWEALGRLDYLKIARQLGAPRREVEDAAQFISRNLTPYPARAYWGSGRGPTAGEQGTFHQPDVRIARSHSDPDGPLVVEVFTPFAGWLRVDPKFRVAVRDCSDEDRAEWGRYVERASLFAKCVPQRNHTMRRLMGAIVREQRNFILHGDRHLAPMTRAGLAKGLGLHESTISRAVAHKTASLPDGRIVPLSKFFDRSLSVRDAVKFIIAHETSPLTDDEIVRALAEQDIHIARRTVAKYRAAEGILPAPIRGRALAASRYSTSP